MEQYVVIDGEFVKRNEAKVPVNNRAFRFGDVLHETMRAGSTTVYFFYDHLQRLLAAMELLDMNPPANFHLTTLGLHDEITKLLTKNKHLRSARIRLTVFRNQAIETGTHPQEVSYLIETEPLDNHKFILSEHGLYLDVFRQVSKPVNAISQLKPANSMLYLLADVFRKRYRLDNCFIVNDKGYLVEAIEANIFIVKGRAIFTPPLSDGCIDGIMRRNLIKTARNSKYVVDESTSLKPEYLLAADEILLTNVIEGINWVSCYKDRRFFNKTAYQLNLRVNNLIIK